MKAWLLRRNRVGLYFAAFALVVTLLSYSFINDFPTFLDTILLYTGFAIPMFAAIVGKGLGGCGLKEIECSSLATTLGYLGFLLGVIVLVLAYYCLGVLLSRLYGK